MTIDSLSESAFTGKTLNSSCTAAILGGTEYVNFAYLTLNGAPLGPPNPVQFQFINSGDPQPVAGRANNDTFFMNQGDNVTVTMSDTPNGLEAVVHDNSNSDPATNTGTMVASDANGFGQVKYAPAGHSCTNMPYTFHPMYSTSSPKTRVLWAAHSYNIAMDVETGHFDFCSSLDADTGLCNGTEGIPGDQEPANGDDAGCFADAQNTNTNYVAPPGQARAYCTFENVPGFDGTSYNDYWPNSTSTHSTAFLFSSPLTGPPTRPPTRRRPSRRICRVSKPRTSAALASDLGQVLEPAAPTRRSRTTGSRLRSIRTSPQSPPRAGCRWGGGSTLPNTINNYNSGPFANTC